MKQSPVPPDVLLTLAPRILEDLREHVADGVELSVMVIIGHRDPEGDDPNVIVFGVSAVTPDDETARRALTSALAFMDSAKVEPTDPRLEKRNLN